MTTPKTTAAAGGAPATAAAASDLSSTVVRVSCRYICDVCSMLSLVLKSRKQVLNEDNLPARAPRSFSLQLGSPSAVADEIDAHAEELRAADAARAKPSCLTLMTRYSLSQRGGFVLSGVALGLGHGVVNSIGRFLLLRASIDAVVSEAPLRTRLQLALGTVVVITCEGLLLIMAKHFWGDHVAQFLGGRQSTLLLRKISRIGKRPAGAEETKYIGSDLTHLLEGIRFVSFMPSGLSGLMGGIAVLIAFMGWGGLAGIVVLYFMFWGNTKLAIMGKKADLTMQARGEDRIRVMKQVVHGIKAVKFYAWEESYTQLLAAARLNEVNASVRFKSLQIAGVVLGRASPIVGTAAVFIVRTAEGATMSASEAFATLAVFQTLRIGMIFLPLSLSFVAMLNNIMRGTERYLDAPEPQPLAGIAADLDDPNGADADLLVRLKDVRAVWEAPGAVATAATGEAATTKPAPSTEKEELEGSVDAEGVELTTKAGSGAEAAASLTGDDDDKDVEESGERDEGGFELRVPKLEVRRGAVVAVVGQVGAGKSMLLETVLAGEPWLLPPENDDDNQTTGGSSSNSSNSSTNFGREVHQASGVGYVPQAALVVSGTVRENVILDRPYDAQRFADAVRRSCFERDLSLLPHGDATVVGERGTTLSGGQQQRLSVARALYGTPGLLVMDDPLAAVDTVVGGKIFDTLLDYVHGKDNDGGVEGGKGKGRAGLLMVLNQLHLLPRCDQVVFMDHGKAACCGTYDQVLARSEGFRSYMSSYQEQSQSGGTADDAALNDSWADGPFQGDVVPMKNEEEVLLGSSSSSTSSSSSAEQAADKDAAAAAAAAEGDAKAAKKDAPEAMTTSGEEPKQLITKEAKTDGVLSNSVLFQYLRSMGLGGVAMNQMILLGSYVCLGVMDLWLSFWTSKVDDGRLTEDNMQKSWFHLSIFCVLSCTFVVMQLVTCLGWVALCGVANKNVHSDCLTTVLRAPLGWFQSVPSGRILSRFGADMLIMDVNFGWMADGCLQMGLSALTILVVLSFTNVKLLVLCLAAMGTFFFLVKTNFGALREMKRIMNNNLSPVVTNVGEAVKGKEVARALGCNDFFVARHIRAMEDFLKASYVSSTLIQFNGISTQCVALTVSITVTLYVLLGPETDPQLAGIQLTYAFLLPYFLSLCSDMAMMWMSLLPVLERLFEYLPSGDLPSEAPRGVPEVDDGLAKQAWPQKGAIEFEGVAMRYRPDLPLFLKNFHMRIEGGDKVGVVGRTGAGKSTLLSILFRLTEAEAGRVTIDGVDVATVGLRLLRSSIAMIPQEPVLIEGSVRENLDPFGKFVDKELLAVLDRVGLTLGGGGGRDGRGGGGGARGSGDDESSTKSLDESTSSTTSSSSSSILDQQVGDGGESLSHGERQLLAVARVLLRKCKVYVMDEPTSNIDPATDEKLQRVIREAFDGATLVTIAHRLHTIADFDKVAVMENGELREMGPPADLLKDKKSAFATMVQALGADAAATIHAKANGR